MAVGGNSYVVFQSTLPAAAYLLRSTSRGAEKAFRFRNSHFLVKLQTSCAVAHSQYEYGNPDPMNSAIYKERET